METTNMWDAAELMAEKQAEGGGKFIRLKNDGDKIVGAFCGDPHTRYVLWTGERVEDYDPSNPAHKDQKPSLRIMVNFYVPAENAMKVYEGGVKWFRDVAKVRAKYGLDKWTFEIERHGVVGDNKTTYSILPDEKVDVAKMIEESGQSLHDLSALNAGAVAPTRNIKTGPEFT